MAIVSLMLATAFAWQEVSPPQRIQPRVIPYAEVVRCAGLAQAASELEGGETAEGRALSDAALYWSLSAAQAASIAGRPADLADADQTRARILAVRQLAVGNPEARTELQSCRRRTPDLN